MRNKHKCKSCGVEFLGRVGRGTYCSQSCSYADRAGERNANFKNAGQRICEMCGNGYKSYQKSSKYCSKDCYNMSRPRKPKQGSFGFGSAKLKRKCDYCEEVISGNLKVKTCGSLDCRRKYSIAAGNRIIQPCQHCGKDFESYQSSNRKLCSYQCHKDSDGPWKSGMAAKLKTRTYGARKDANHKEIVSILESLFVGVIDTSGLAGGFPDLICAVNHETLLVEIKNKKTAYGKGGLNKNQKKFAESWRGGPVYVVTCREDCVLLANSQLDSLYSYGGFNQENVARSGSDG